MLPVSYTHLDVYKRQAEYTGDGRELRRGLILARVDVRAEVARVLPDVRRRADDFAAHLMPTLRRAPQPLSVDCRHCEYLSLIHI